MAVENILLLLTCPMTVSSASVKMALNVSILHPIFSAMNSDTVDDHDQSVFYVSLLALEGVQFLAKRPARHAYLQKECKL
ncbi:hypothetical protein JB92DRAFT_2870699 [Gautieria morchelliformis]|nr:hypothetical protein JB92DRAFT_2870699 [Gautieria morchelliformis]